METRITRLLGIQYPIIQASMAWIADAALAAAVSQAGGLGLLGPNAGARAVATDPAEVGRRLREQIRLVKKNTDNSFGVNFVVGIPGFDRQFSDVSIEVAVQEGVPVAVVSQGSPAVYTKRLKEAGLKVIHVCSTVRHARKAEENGVDAVIASGTEGGGHSGFHQSSTLCLIPQVVDAVSLPVVAGGGIGDERGLMAALALGAEGVYMGTRFIATHECPAHEKVKRVLLAADDISTIALRHGSPVPISSPGTGDRGFVEERRGSLRLILNSFIQEALARKGGELSFDELLGLLRSPDPQSGSNRTVACFLEGQIEENPVSAGQVAGLIREVLSCQELIQRLVQGQGAILARLNRVFKG
ncbi:MAG: nitronate monooxygenase [Thermodesulfobacteriota bacterium]